MESPQENSPEISAVNLQVISRLEVAAQLRVDPKTVTYWERKGRIRKGPWFTEGEARAAATYHRLDEHLKSKDGATAMAALPQPGSAGYEVMASVPLYLVFGRISSSARLALSMAEVADLLPFDEDVRVVRLDEAMAAMSGHFQVHRSTVTTGASGQILSIREAAAQRSTSASTEGLQRP